MRRIISPGYFHFAVIVVAIAQLLWPSGSFAQTSIFNADFENNLGDNAWIFNGGATDGNWLRGQPNPYNTGAITMEIPSFNGNNDLVTGIQFIQDVDAGPTSARSQSFQIPSGLTFIEFQYYFSYYINSSSADYLDVELRSDLTDATLITLTSEVGSGAGQDAGWSAVSVDISSLAGEDIYIYVEAADLGNPSKVEAALDQIVVTNTTTGGNVDCAVVISDDFESGLGNWDDPGSDCTRLNNAGFASNGNFSIRLRDNTITSSTTSISLDLSVADSVLVDFSYFPNSMESGEDFWLQISTDGGFSFTTIQTWASGTDFTNGIRYFEHVNISSPLTSDTRFRFVCDASGNGDQVYFDEITITVCTSTAPIACPDISLSDTLVCRPQILLVDGDPISDSTIIAHQWVDLGLGTASGVTLTNDMSQMVSINTLGATPGSVHLSYTASTATCSTVVLQIHWSCRS